MTTKDGRYRFTIYSTKKRGYVTFYRTVKGVTGYLNRIALDPNENIYDYFIDRIGEHCDGETKSWIPAIVWLVKSDKVRLTEEEGGKWLTREGWNDEEFYRESVKG